METPKNSDGILEVIRRFDQVGPEAAAEQMLSACLQQDDPEAAIAGMEALLRLASKGNTAERLHKMAVAKRFKNPKRKGC
jgi:hypothetical protein